MTERMRDDRYRAYVAGLRCALCRERDGTVVAHHLKHVGMFSGAGMKCSDLLTIPLCSTCHREVHHRVADFKVFQLTACLHTIEDALAEGVIVIKR